jgi:hypothetical protein
MLKVIIACGALAAYSLGDWGPVCTLGGIRLGILNLIFGVALNMHHLSSWNSRTLNKGLLPAGFVLLLMDVCGRNDLHLSANALSGFFVTMPYMIAGMIVLGLLGAVCLEFVLFYSLHVETFCMFMRIHNDSPL